jgi:hypothetical protein
MSLSFFNTFTPLPCIHQFLDKGKTEIILFHSISKSQLGNCSIPFPYREDERWDVYQDLPCHVGRGGWCGTDNVEWEVSQISYSAFDY